MAGPMQMYVYIHDAILRDVAEMEELAREMNRDDANEIAALAERYDLFHTLVKKHEQTEEDILFPAMNERIRFVAEAYLYDHNDSDEHVFAGITDAFAALGRATGNGERKEGRADYGERTPFSTRPCGSISRKKMSSCCPTSRRSSTSPNKPSSPAPWPGWSNQS